MKDSTDNALQQEAARFIDGFCSVCLATVSEAGLPHASYAPFVRDDMGCFYIYVSELATHGQNLLAGSSVSLLFVEGEQQAAQIYARKRFTLHCDPQQLKVDGEGWAAAMVRMEQAHGKVISVLKTLDFHLFRLTPESGNYVRGFGKSDSFSKEELRQIVRLPSHP